MTRDWQHALASQTHCEFTCITTLTCGNLTAIVELSFTGDVWHNFATTPASLISLLILASARQILEIALMSSISWRTCAAIELMGKKHHSELATDCVRSVDVRCLQYVSDPDFKHAADTCAYHY